MYRRLLLVCLIVMLLSSQGVFATSSPMNNDFCAYLTDEQGNIVNLDVSINQNNSDTGKKDQFGFTTSEERITARVELNSNILSRADLSNVQEVDNGASQRGSINDGDWDSTGNVYVETTIHFDKKTKDSKAYYKLTKVDYNLTNYNYDGRIQIVDQSMSMYCRGPQSLDSNGVSAGITNQNKTTDIANFSGSINTGFTKYAFLDSNISSIGATYIVEIKRNSGSWYLTFVNNR